MSLYKNNKQISGNVKYTNIRDFNDDIRIRKEEVESTCTQAVHTLESFATQTKNEFSDIYTSYTNEFTSLDNTLKQDGERILNELNTSYTDKTNALNQSYTDKSSSLDNSFNEKSQSLTNSYDTYTSNLNQLNTKITNDIQTSVTNGINTINTTSTNGTTIVTNAIDEGVHSIEQISGTRVSEFELLVSQRKNEFNLIYEEDKTALNSLKNTCIEEINNEYTTDLESINNTYNSHISQMNTVHDSTLHVVDAIGGSTVGNEKPWRGDTPPANFLLLNGGIISRTDFPELWQWATSNNLVKSDSDWVTRKLYGFYGDGDGTSTFRLPDLRGLYFVGYDSKIHTALGEFQPYTMPNLTGSFTIRGTNNSLPHEDSVAEGVFDTEVQSGVTGSLTGSTITHANLVKKFKLDLSKQVNVGETVAPPSIPVNWIVCYRNIYEANE